MATTPIYALPYYAGTDIPAGMTQQQNLALAVDAALATLPQGRQAAADANDTGTVLLAATGGIYRPANTVAQLVLTSQRLIRLDVVATVTVASGTAGRYNARAAYNAGPTLATPVLLSPNMSRTIAIAAGTTDSIAAYGLVVLPAGTYQVYPTLSRSVGGNGNDAINGQCDVTATDLGAA